MKGINNMKKIMRKTCWSLLLAAGLILPACAQDEAGGAKPEMDNESRREEMAKKLNLNAEQKEKMNAMRQDHKKQMAELQQAMQAKRAKLRDELNNPSATRESVSPLANEIKVLMAKMVDLRIEGVLGMKSILTPEQFSQLQQARQESGKDERDRKPFWLNKKGPAKPRSDWKE